MSYQPGWNPSQNTWSPNGPNVQQPLNGLNLPQPPQSGFQIPPQISETARQTLAEIGAQMDRDYIKTIPGCLSVMTTVSFLNELLLQIITFNQFFKVTSFLAFVISSANSASLFTLISGFGFWCALIFFVINMFQVPSKVPTLPWLQLVSFYNQIILSRVLKLSFFFDAFLGICLFGGLDCTLLFVHLGHDFSFSPAWSKFFFVVFS